MAKGRKLTTSRSERLLGIYGNGPTAGDSPELDEDEVWSVVSGGDEQPRHGSQGAWPPRAGGKRVGMRSPVGGLSLAFEDKNKSKTVSHGRIVHQFIGQQEGMVGPRGPRHVATSAPVDVPDWSKIYRVDSVESLHESDVYDDDHEDEVVPPHEYLAREYRRIAANSVFEGAGRTLKGRDMSRVRDSVWGRTGFDG